MHQIAAHKYLIAILLFLFATIGITVFLSQRSTDFRQRAATSAFYDTFFPVGAFDATIPGPNELTSYINDVQPKGMDSLMMNNNFITNSLQQQMITVADQKGLNYFIGPQGELYNQWWQNSTVTQDLASAKQIAQPLVDLMKTHPSLKGYNLADDASLFSIQKRNLMQQAFYELDPTRQVSYINGGGDRYDFVNNIQPRALYSYSYPAAVGFAACDWRRGDNGQRDWVDQIRIGSQFTPDNTPRYQILQTHQTQKDINGNILNDTTALRYPTVEELRLQQWLAIGEDSKGLFWFTYSDLPDNAPGHPAWIGWKNNAAFYTEITDLSNRIKSFKSTLAQLKKIDDKFTVSGTGKTYASSFLHRVENRLFVLIANRECTQQTLTLASTYVTGQLKDLETNQTQPITTPITLRGGDGKVFELVNATLISPQPTLPPATNLLQNPGFETLDATGKPVAWTAGATQIDTTVTHSGSKSLKVAGPQNELYFWTRPLLKPSTKYMMSLWIKTVNATAVGGEYIVESPGIPGFFASARIGGTKDWTKVFSLFTTPANFADGRLDVRFTLPSGGTAWVDDVTVCEVNDSCNPLSYTQLQPFTGTSPTPTPPITTVTSVIPGVSYQTTPWTGTEITQFMKSLTTTVITHHAKKNLTGLPELKGLLYQWITLNPDKAIEGTGWDTMHNGAWIGNAMATAYRATLDPAFLDTLNNYPLTLYPTLLNNSDKYFVLGLTDDQARVSDLSQIPRPTNYPNNPVTKGLVPYWYDNGEAVSLDSGPYYLQPMIGYKGSKYTSLHMQQDLATMLANTIMMTQRNDEKLALKNLVLANSSAYAEESGGHPSSVSKFFALKLNPTDTELSNKFGSLPGVVPSLPFNNPSTPPFGRTRFYNQIYLNEYALTDPFTGISVHADDFIWSYYKTLIDQDRKPLDDQTVKNLMYMPYINLVVDQLWYGNYLRQQGTNLGEGQRRNVGEKFAKYYAPTEPDSVVGARLAGQMMYLAAVDLQLMKAFPNAWERWYKDAFPNDTRVEMRWRTKPTIDGVLDATGYSNPVTIDTDVTARFASSIDSLTVFVDRPLNKSVPLTIYARADAGALGATLTLNEDSTLAAKGRNGTDDLLVTKANVKGTREQVEINIPYTIVQEQKPWANALDDTRFSVKGGNGIVTNLFFLSTPQTIREVFEKELVEGLRFWQAYYNAKGMLASRLYTDNGRAWNNYSDTGSYAYVITAAAAYKEYLDNKNEWDLYRTVTTVGVTPQPTTIVTPPLTPTPTKTPTPSPQPTPGVNLLLNSSFETNNNGVPANWSGGTWDNTVARTGVASMKRVGPLTNTYAWQKPTLKPSTTYTFQGWIKTENVPPGDWGAQIRYVNVPGASESTTRITGTNNWTFVTKTWTTPPDWSTLSRLDLFVDITGGTVWFDDVALCEGTCSGNTPTTTQVSPTPTRTPTPTPTSPISLTGDINKDGRVDLLDFNIWRDEFMGTVTTKQSDLNNDSKVDLLDFNIWLTAYKGM